MVGGRDLAIQAWWVLLCVAVIGCSESPRAVEWGTERCARCEQVISDRRFAAQYSVGDAVKGFDDPGCLFRSLAGEPAAERIFFRDHGGDGWVADEKAWFVHAPTIDSPREYDWAAYPSFGAAQQVVTTAGSGEILPFAEARDRIGSERSEAAATPAPTVPPFRVVTTSHLDSEALHDSPGAQLFLQECAGCHGERGDGRGLADPTLLPPPADLTTGTFAIRASSTRHPIRVDELTDTLRRGLPGSSMPSYSFLSDEQLVRLAEHVRTIAYGTPGPGGPRLHIPERPETTPARIERGREHYVRLGCASCHGDQGRGDGPTAPMLRDASGNPNPPRDLTREPFRGGHEPAQVFLRLRIGMPGTQMPGYGEMTSGNELWELVAYLESIWDPPPPPREGRARAEHLIETHACRACHALRGRGGKIGPSLDRALARLRPEWLRAYLADPRAHDIDPQLVSRMPDLDLSESDLDALVPFLLTLHAPTPAHHAAAVPEGDPERGASVFAEHCAGCHARGAQPATGEPGRAGPDLALARARLRPAVFRSAPQNPSVFHPHDDLPRFVLGEKAWEDLYALLFGAATQ